MHFAISSGATLLVFECERVQECHFLHLINACTVPLILTKSWPPQPLQWLSVKLSVEITPNAGISLE